jgi:hypothetical protein
VGSLACGGKKTEVPMIQTVEAVIDATGHVRMFGKVAALFRPPRRP